MGLAESGNNLAAARVLLPKDVNRFGERHAAEAMSKETQRLPARLDWDNLASDALELARQMPPGPERNQALSQLRCTGDARGLIFWQSGAGRESETAARTGFEPDQIHPGSMALRTDSARVGIARLVREK